MLRAHDQAAAALGERDHRAVSPRERGRLAGDEVREIPERELAGRREADVVEHGELLGAPALPLHEAPVREERQARSDGEQQDRYGDRGVDPVGEARRHSAYVGVDEEERAGGGHERRERHP